MNHPLKERKPLKDKKCKGCGNVFSPVRPLQAVCSPECGYSVVQVLEKKKRQKELQVEKKDWQDYKKRRSPIVYEKDNTYYLQNEINRLSKMIDNKFSNPCIDCNRGYGAQQDGAHYHSVGAHSNVRFNLHNVHAARSECNQHDPYHKTRYAKGLKQRYGNDYLEMVEGLPLKYPKIKLSAVEVAEKLKMVRKLIRDFSTFVFTDAMQAREQLNKLINIYQ